MKTAIMSIAFALVAGMSCADEIPLVEYMPSGLSLPMQLAVAHTVCTIALPVTYATDVNRQSTVVFEENFEEHVEIFNQYTNSDAFRIQFATELSDVSTGILNRISDNSILELNVELQCLHWVGI
jgi:hypothetical protein